MNANEILAACEEMIERFSRTNSVIFPKTRARILENPKVGAEELRQALGVGELRHNRIRCKLCDSIIESNHRHDFKYCPCGKSFIDGGSWYTRFGGTLGQIENLSELWPWLKEK